MGVDSRVLGSTTASSHTVRHLTLDMAVYKCCHDYVTASQKSAVVQSGTVQVLSYSLKVVSDA